MSRPLTRQQYERLRILGSGCFVVAPTRKGWEPLVRRGLVTAIPPATGSDWAAFGQITPDGLRALAVASERYGLPELPRRDPAVAGSGGTP